MGGHTLDLIITCEFDHITASTPAPDHFLSDYKAILCSINNPKPPLAVKNLRYRITRQINVQSLMNDFSASRLCGNMPHQLNDWFTAILPHSLIQLSTMHMLRLSHAKITIRPDIPWFNDEKLKGNDDKLTKILICATLKP